ncbi:cytochrome P450 [Microthyrium microscopicum]|uniref:Cytochrome P450 n=1 Tax=Microthyrium microscopicum TaxID=703497 RepID=A0A6A6U389_9PEZI|nr:cytochrome P450 [Microthyrium microscopicum]
MLSPYILSLIACGLLYYALQSYKSHKINQEISEREGCKPAKCLPNRLPLGIDKLFKVMEAEKAKAYPLLMLGDHEKFGDTYGQKSGPLYTIITRDPENIRDMLSRKFKDFEIGSARHGCLSPLLGDGIFTQDGAKWEHSRKLLAPMIQRSTLLNLELVEKHFQKLLGKIGGDGAGEKDGSFFANMKPPLFDLSLELTTEFLLGDPAIFTGKTGISEASTSDSSVWGTEFAKEYNTAFKWIYKRERLKQFYWLVNTKELRDSCRATRDIVARVIGQAYEALKDNSTSLGQHIAFAPLLHQGVDTEFVRDQFLNLLLAGRDTSGSLLCWIFYALSREPGLFKMLKEEMEGLLGEDRERKPSKSELGRMVLLDQFMTETLRLFPPVPINGRFCKNATTFPRGGGEDGLSPMLVPKGTLIALSTFATHRSTDLYGEDAGKFSIERWNDNVVNERMVDWSFHPFIGGPRKCLGERFALDQAKYLTCRVLQHFEKIVAADETGNELKQNPEENWVDNVKYHVGLTMSPDAGVFVRLAA